MTGHRRRQIDLEAYHERARTGPCFICSIVARDPEFPAHIVYEDELAIAFLDKYPHMYGHTLVAPREHREQVTGDFTVEEYVALQRVVHRVAEAVREEVGAARVYLLPLGSNEGNSHVHWHIAPLPTGVPYGQQQLAALRGGPLDIPEEEQAALAGRIPGRLDHHGASRSCWASTSSRAVVRNTRPVVHQGLRPADRGMMCDRARPLSDPSANSGQALKVRKAGLSSGAARGKE